LCESFHDEVMEELGTRLLRALDWRGVAMVEFKRDRRTGEYKLLEVNPRFWGSLPLALHCGVVFPVYQAQLALGLTPDPPAGYPTGRKMRFFFSDLLAVRQQWRTGNRRAVAVRYLRELFDPSIKDGLFDVDDPRPVATYVRQRLKR
jgi:predicted ATP-grasp superfamily ATP-dependent carboligase